MNNDTLYNSNTMGATSLTGTVCPYGAPEFTMHSALSTIVCHFVLFCLTIALSAFLRFAVSDL